MSLNLEDFRIAAEASKVNLIPFRDLRIEATSIADEVQLTKKEAFAFSTSTFEDQKTKLLDAIKKKTDEIEGIKKEKG